jgi:NAD(P)-dependent dehydrogenase (short-subunit alcohol dehydrogenase family)
MNPRDQEAVVTGGASGLGKETAILLARAGAKVAVLDLNGEAARETAYPDSATAALAKARDQHWPARIVISCAGIGTAKRT